MNRLNQDVLIEMFSYLVSDDIVNCYPIFETIIQELSLHIGFAIQCKSIIDDKMLRWFKSKNIKLKLMKEHYINLMGNEVWRMNGEIHRDDDLPAIIYKDGTRAWYQNGVSRRDNNKPHVIRAREDGRFDYIYQKCNGMLRIVVHQDAFYLDI